MKHCQEYIKKGRGQGGTLTSLVLRVRMRSRSSTSCLKVGLWEEMACQQSFIIMYLVDAKSHSVCFKKTKGSRRKSKVLLSFIEFVRAVAFIEYIPELRDLSAEMTPSYF